MLDVIIRESKKIINKGKKEAAVEENKRVDFVWDRQGRLL